MLIWAAPLIVRGILEAKLPVDAGARYHRLVPYALLLFHKVKTERPPTSEGIPMVPLFRGTFAHTHELLVHVRAEYGRGIFVLPDTATGQVEEWNGRTEGGYELVPARDCLPVDALELDEPPLSAVLRVFLVSPLGKREVTPYWVHQYDD